MHAISAVTQYMILNKHISIVPGTVRAVVCAMIMAIILSPQFAAREVEPFTRSYYHKNMLSTSNEKGTEMTIFGFRPGSSG